MKRLLAFAFLPFTLSSQPVAPLRPPATPLIAHDPYFSIWMMGDDPTGKETRHWTGAVQALTGLIRIDGTPFRFLGTEPRAVTLPFGDKSLRKNFRGGDGN